MRALIRFGRLARVVAAMALICFVAVGCAGNGSDPAVGSPDGRLELSLAGEAGRGLTVAVRTAGRPAVERSPLALNIDGVEVTRDARVVAVEPYRVRDEYAWHGNHSPVKARGRGVRVGVLHAPTGTRYTVDLRAYDDGVAFRYVLPAAADTRRVPDEATTFVLPAGSTVWHHDLGAHYEGVHERADVASVGAGTWVAPPMTFKLPDGRGYGSITEANLVGYPGMALQADGRRGFVVRLAHAQPVARTYTLRHTPEEAKRQTVPAAIAGTITTPWRVIMLGRDLDQLVNSDVVHNLCPPPDRALFPKGAAAEWIRPGRAVWRYLDGGIDPESGRATAQAPRSTAPSTGPTTQRRGVTPAEAKLFSKYAAGLTFEHNVLEGFWRRWSEEELRDVVEYSRELGVGVWLWEFSKTLADPGRREEFFAMCERVGVAGAKVDFFDSESLEMVELYREILTDAARHRVLLNFHGANKPTGLQRTFPNALTYEAVKGMEARSLAGRARHETTLPFTRCLAGPAEYTVVHFDQRRGDTTATHQLASAAILSTPLLTYAANPKRLLEHPAAELVKSVPAVWDETIVLPPSEIGELACFARRSGGTWFLAVMNGPEAREVSIPLRFLPPGVHRVLAAADHASDADQVDVRRFNVNRGDAVPLRLPAGGGFLARFDRAESP